MTRLNLLHSLIAAPIESLFLDNALSNWNEDDCERIRISYQRNISDIIMVLFPTVLLCIGRWERNKQPECALNLSSSEQQLVFSNGVSSTSCKG